MTEHHQLHRYIVYTCNNCGWQTAIVSQWADLKPKRCRGHKCTTNFSANPEALDIKVPEPIVEQEEPVVEKKSKKKK